MTFSREACAVRSIDFAQRHRPSLGRRDQRRFQHALRLVGVFEVGNRHGRLVAGKHLQDVIGLVDEAVLVAEDVGIGPPVAPRRDGRRRGCT